jgi:hypothetical protein
MNRSLRLVLGAAGAWLCFIVLMDGYTRAVLEVGRGGLTGKALSNHMVSFCPNWLLGVATGAFGVGMAWWVVSSVRGKS